MEYCEGKKFNLKNQRPKVLLFGNGFFYNDCDWEKFLKDSKKDDVDNSFFELKNLPYSIKADSGIDTDDKRRREKYKAALKEIPCSNSNPLVKKLLHIQFDAILTTNYTYQLEQHIDNTYKSCSEQRKRSKYAKTTINRNEKSAKLEKQDAKILLHIYNHLDNNGISQDIWHIHGEERRISSVVLTHDEYGRLVEKILAENSKIGNKYNNYFNDVKFKSWIDYFLMGDVFILGLGMDYSEFDLWWLLNRRLREKAKVGKVFFYEPEKEWEKSKYLALKEFSIIRKSLNIKVPQKADNESDEEYKAKINKSYNVFYEKAIEDIDKQIKQERNAKK